VPLYKYLTYLHASSGNEFDKAYSPGDRVAWSGIYRCTGCGHEVVHTNEKPLPPQNHHQHKLTQGKIQWKLVVTDYTEPS
jgi:hypothetical protein